MTDLLDLADRCEKAAGPDRQIDVDILFEVVWEGQGHEPPQTPFTASIDAALTLVPEGWSKRQYGTDGFSDSPCYATLTYDALRFARAKTEPLAICAAALRARAA